MLLSIYIDKAVEKDLSRVSIGRSFGFLMSTKAVEKDLNRVNIGRSLGFLMSTKT